MRGESPGGALSDPARASAAPTAGAASVSTWDKVAQCESGGNWSIVSNTTPPYYGGLQFAKSTWDAFGGRQYEPYAHQTTKEQQILIAEKVLAVQGQGAWPRCGPAAGLGADHADPYPVPSDRGAFHHAIRTVAGHWTPFAPLDGYGGATRFEGSRQSVTSTPDGSVHIVGTGTDGKLYHNARYASGGWQGWNPVAGYGGASGFTASGLAIAALPNGDAQLLATGNDGGLYHNSRFVGGGWQGWARVPGIASPADIALTGMPNGDVQLLAVANGTTVYHNARYANGTWQGWNPAGAHARKVGITGLTTGDAHILTTGG